MVLLDCPLSLRVVCGAEFNLVPKAFWKAIQNLEMNLGYQSNTMLTGTPCNLTILSMYRWANLSKDEVALIVRKCVDFVNRLTITQMA